MQQNDNHQEKYGEETHGERPDEHADENGHGKEIPE